MNEQEILDHWTAGRNLDQQGSDIARILIFDEVAAQQSLGATEFKMPAIIIDTLKKECPAYNLPTVEEWRKTAVMSRADFAVVAAQQGWITEQEAEAWVASASIPSAVADVIGSMPEAMRFKARIEVLGLATIPRRSGILHSLMAEKGVTEAVMDGVFGVSAALLTP